jgi:Protein of unknown function (DUF2950)
MEQAMMRIRNRKKASRKWNVTWLAVLVALSMFAVRTFAATGSSAKQTGTRTFTSPEQASNSLFQAVQSNDEESLESILGAGKEVTSSGNDVADRLEREQFRKKYEEMHRLVQEPDGTTVLYIGAENWPFPIPLVSKEGRWSFDCDAGMQEIQFRRIGENETSASQVAADFAHPRNQQEMGSDADSSIRRYALSLANGASADPKEFGPFHGYYFRPLARTSNGKKKDAVVLIAYPAEYRSTGVMTFIVTESGGVYETDLGTNTAKLATTIRSRKSPAHWRALQATELTRSTAAESD